jgi:hypothetical protein
MLCCVLKLMRDNVWNEKDQMMRAMTTWSPSAHLGDVKLRKWRRRERGGPKDRQNYGEGGVGFDERNDGGALHGGGALCALN